MLAHSGSKCPELAKNKFTWFNFTSFFTQTLAGLSTSISVNYMPFIFKSFQIATATSMISFKDFWILFLAGFCYLAQECTISTSVAALSCCCYKYPLYRVILWRHSYVDTMLPDSLFQNIVKFFVRNSHDFVEWTWAIQSEHETLINHSASKPEIQSEWKTTLRSFNNYVDRILPIFKLKIIDCQFLN